MSQLAYLVIREGSKWSDVFRLVPGQSVLVGRAPTNQIVIKDERCSRTHVEVFMSAGQWTLRDLDSRNGTIVGDQVITGDVPLKPGDVIRIGHTQLVFVYKLSDAFSDPSTLVRRPSPDTAAAGEPGDESSSVLTASEPTTITHRRVQTKFLLPGEEEESGVSKIGRASAKLCRLAFELAKAPDVSSLAETALKGLAEGTSTDSGGVLMVPRDFQGEPRGEDLEIIAARSPSHHKYHRVSNFLASTVMREGEAVMARNVMGDSALGNRDSQGEILATSVICTDSPRAENARRNTPLFHQGGTGTRSRRSRVHPGRGRYPGRGPGKPQPPPGTGREPDPSPHRKRATPRAIGRAKRNHRPQPGHPPGDRGISRAAASNATVLIRGESGVGKELVARAVHYNSPRRDNVFVCLNCAALSTELLASELFGHERGAFTGATERKIGKFEAAHKGTLMLDEIGEMSPSIQAKFLRVLEGHPFERVGGSKPITVDVRVIAATNRDLEKDIADGRFRRDLFFRLRVLEIVVPGLRKRPEDVPLLADYFLQRFNNETGRKIKGFTAEAKSKLLSYQWPGNVRELKNVVERAVVLCRGQEIGEEDLLLTNLSTAGDTEVPLAGAAFAPISLDDIERRHILNTLQYTNWNKSKTASILGIERSTLDRKIRRFDLGGEDSES